MGELSFLQTALLAPSVILGLWFIAFCAVVLIRSQPLVLKGQIAAGILILAVLPVNAGIIYLAVIASETSIICYGIFILAIQVIAFSTVVRAMRGTFIIGVSADGCRTAVREVLGELGIPFSETITGFDFVERSEKLKVAIAARLGTAQLRVEGGEGTDVIKSISRQLNVYFRMNRGDYSLQSALIFGASGIVALLLAAYQWTKF